MGRNSPNAIFIPPILKSACCNPCRPVRRFQSIHVARIIRLSCLHIQQHVDGTRVFAFQTKRMPWLDFGILVRSKGYSSIAAAIGENVFAVWTGMLLKFV